jgi:hypothetical protein
MAKSGMLQRGNKVEKSAKNGKINSDYLTDEEDGFSETERGRISEELSDLYIQGKTNTVVDILLDIQKRLLHVEKLLQSGNNPVKQPKV